MTNEHLPPLFRPAKYRREMLANGAYQHVTAYTEDDMHRYAREALKAQAAEIRKLENLAHAYDEAMHASNTAGYSGMSAAETIVDLVAEIERLRAALKQNESSPESDAAMRQGEEE